MSLPGVADYSGKTLWYAKLSVNTLATKSFFDRPPRRWNSATGAAFLQQVADSALWMSPKAWQRSVFFV
jgi:hypothetical protein